MIPFIDNAAFSRNAFYFLCKKAILINFREYIIQVTV